MPWQTTSLFKPPPAAAEAASHQLLACTFGCQAEKCWPQCILLHALIIAHTHTHTKCFVLKSPTCTCSVCCLACTLLQLVQLTVMLPPTPAPSPCAQLALCINTPFHLFGAQHTCNLSPYSCM